MAWPFVLDDPFIATGDFLAPFAALEIAALCSGDAPEPFENGLEVPFVVLLSPSNLILEP